MKKQIDSYMTVAEAAHRWGINVETVKNKLKPSIKSYRAQVEMFLEEGLIKFFMGPGGKRKEWIITEAAMERWFGEGESKTKGE